MSWLAVVGATLQLLLIWFQWVSEDRTAHKKKIKEVKDEFAEALKDRDYARTALLWAKSRRMR